MEQFVVSARKYRPLTFDSVVGQGHISTTLKNAIANQHLAHAFLFCGPRGVGKTTCARILAKTINCENLQDNIEACGKCNSCVSFANNTSFVIHELDAASNNSVEDIRALVEQVRYPPQSGRYKIYIIDEVHMLSQAAFNAFLKTLEEPPSYAIFILATTEKHKILPTILSRCQIFDFNRISIQEIVNHLNYVAQKEGLEVEEDALNLIAQKADGGMRDSLSMFDLIATYGEGKRVTYDNALKNLHVLDYDYFFQLINLFGTNDIAGTLLLYDQILAKGFDGSIFLQGLATHLRNLLVMQDPRTVSLLELTEGVQAKFKEQAAKVDVGFILTGLTAISEADAQYKTTRNNRLLIELLLVKLCHLNKMVSSSAYIDALGEAAPAEKKKLIQA